MSYYLRSKNTNLFIHNTTRKQVIKTAQKYANQFLEIVKIDDFTTIKDHSIKVCYKKSNFGTKCNIRFNQDRIKKQILK